MGYSKLVNKLIASGQKLPGIRQVRATPFARKMQGNARVQKILRSPAAAAAAAATAVAGGTGYGYYADPEFRDGLNKILAGEKVASDQELYDLFSKYSADMLLNDPEHRKQIPMLSKFDRRKTRYFRGPKGFKTTTKKEVTPTGRERTY